MSKKRLISTVSGFVILIFLAGFVRTSSYPKQINVLIITGGHDFEHVPFYNVFSGHPHIRCDTMVQPRANAVINSEGINRYDVLVFYDMVDSLLPVEQQAYVNLLRKGKAMIFLHHSLVSYQNWPEFIKIVGGQYHTKPVVAHGDTLKSSYEHDVVMPIKIEGKGHPITKGITDFDILDEVYGGTEILPTVIPLLGTTQTKSMRYVAWINRYGNSDVVYIQLGHGPSAYENTNYRKLIQQAIEWSAARHAQAR